MRAMVKGALALVLGALGLAALAFVASTLYGQFGAPRVEANSLAWAIRTPIYTSSGCASCHATPATATTPHAGVQCELCHVPTVAHPGSVSGVVQALPLSTSATCVACHARTAGRPASFPQVELSAHFATAECLSCHDPHTTLAVAPPEVTHPLANLPACTTCHSPTGLKRFPAGHQPAADNVCLACHLPSRRAD